jgi:hypothetical protein
MQLGSGVVKVTVGTGGSGYGSAPSVTISGGGGTGAAAVAQMAGTMVQGVIITNAGTGYTSAPTVSFSAGAAAATASILSFAGTTPVTFFKGRHDMYGVDGHGRGFRWDGETPYLEPLGISKPASFAAPVGSTSGQKYYVAEVQVIDRGNGYASVPGAAFTGGGATTSAAAVVTVANGRVSGVRLTDRGTGYTAAPQVSFVGGQGSSAAFTCNVQGSLVGLEFLSVGAGYTGAPTVTFHNTQGLTGANVVVGVDTDDKVVVGADVLAGGTGATATGVTVSLTGGGATTQASAVPVLEYSVHSVSVANSGTGYMSPPVITFYPHPQDYLGGGAAATCAINSAGQITGVTVLAGGRYSLPPTAAIADTSAKALAVVAPTIKGIYQCCIRYLDDTPESQGGPIPSSISELKEIDATTGLQSLTWSLNNQGMESRVHAIELWRTTADQSVVLYRVARIDKVDGVFTTTSYVDTLTDLDLLDTDRNTVASNVSGVYGLMPIVLPSGQVNARRFDPPPQTMAVGCMFQDRAWYAVDTTGSKPNSLYYSEVDEPESVPESNELVVQENAIDSDAIVALIPFGGSMLIAQNRHVYRLQYVSQPIIDASITLVSYRGAMNSRCWDVFGGVAFIADDYGVYAFDGSQEQAISAPIDNYWRDGIIDFTKRKYFYVKASPQERVIRFFYCQAADGIYPKRALCYSLSTQAWWEETFPQAMSHAAASVAGQRQTVLYGGEAGKILQPGGRVDATTSGGTTAVPWLYRSSPRPLVDEKGNRSLGILYTPTPESMAIGLHYNNSTAARTNAVAADRGDGVTVVTGSSVATLNMASDRSALGQATGYARVSMSGRVDEMSAGGDRHVAIALSGTQSTGAVQLHSMTVAGAS